nr:class I tRNA ligase family protein [Haloactinopolyspora sp.]
MAWPYANGPRHIGHVSGFGVPSDVFAGYQRMAGSPVLMVSGTDEHGTPIQVQADAEELTPQQAADPRTPVARLRRPTVQNPRARGTHRRDDDAPR